MLLVPARVLPFVSGITWRERRVRMRMEVTGVC